MILLMDKLLHTAVGAWPLKTIPSPARLGREHQKKIPPSPCLRRRREPVGRIMIKRTPGMDPEE
jgi:hypothetical protein